jgi:hypothetical protein
MSEYIAVVCNETWKFLFSIANPVHLNFASAGGN